MVWQLPEMEVKMRGNEVLLKYNLQNPAFARRNESGGWDLDTDFSEMKFYNYFHTTEALDVLYYKYLNALMVL